MEELRVPTRLIPVEIQTTAGRMLGSLFVSFNRANAEQDVADTLNDERSFLPFSPDDGEQDPSALNKDHLIQIRLEASDEVAELDPFPCTLRLADGSSLDGGLLVDTPLAASRLLDKLNRAPRFVKFVTEDSVHFVRSSMIVRVY